jgi:enoyl-[acyl-carrier protein] reductase / trans-2-enoyl-CoA reductase (NAD+)
MIIKPRIKGFVCITSHPVGCLENVRDQINHAKDNLITHEGKPKRVLVIGVSTGYGLSSRVSAAFSAGAETLGVFFERPPKEDKPASAGFYNSLAFEKFSREAGIRSFDINGDAFSNECKDEVIKKAKQMGQFDLVVYSLASPRRTDPSDGETYRACLKPIGSVYKNKTLDTDKREVKEVVIDPATDAEIESTEKVMGGDDWTLWTERLLEENLLAPGCINVAYSYIGPEVTQPIYRNGTIGRAKEHLENCAHALNDLLQEKVSGRSFVSVNKAVVTQASSAIPVVPLYVSILFKIMRKAGTHEGCIEQTARLFSCFLYTKSASPMVDTAGRIRLDDWEMKDEIQQEIINLWPQVNTSNLTDLTAFEEYQTEFLKLFGFAHPRVNYEEEIDLISPF